MTWTGAAVKIRVVMYCRKRRRFGISAGRGLSGRGCGMELRGRTIPGGAFMNRLDLTTDQWGRELAFVGLYIIPVYPIATFGDLFVVNSIEFWSGENPMTGESPLSLAGQSAPAAPSQ